MAAAALLLAFVDDVFLSAALQLLPQPDVPRDAGARIARFQRVFVVQILLSWLGVCAVKFSFLVFFREILRRQAGRAMLWWWAACPATAVATVYLAVVEPIQAGESVLGPRHIDSFNSCLPVDLGICFGLMGAPCHVAACTRSKLFRMKVMMSYFGTIADIGSDICSEYYPYVLH